MSQGHGRVRVGTSGWQYDSWRGPFYPRDLPRTTWLRWLATRLDTVELNGSFYALQKPSSYRRWYDDSPDDFVFAVKGGRYVTHLKRLVGVDTGLANFFASGVLRLGEKLGPVLWQLPERVAFDGDVVEAFLALLPQSTDDVAALARRHDGHVSAVHLEPLVEGPVRHALEVRHASFDDRAFPALLEKYGVASVVAESAGRWPRFDWQTADFAYVRLHGDTELYTSSYSDQAIKHWAERCREWSAAGRDVFVYFDNDAHGHAPRDALRLANSP